MAYATAAHAGQVRKGTAIPYISHPKAVAALVRGFGGGDEQITAPALLRRPKHLLSGLLCCGSCDGAYTIVSGHKLGCSIRIESGTCDNRRRLRVADVEERVLTGIQKKLLAPDVIREALVSYHEERKRLSATAGDRKRALERRIHEKGREIERLVDAIAAGTASKAIGARVVQLEEKKEAAQTALANHLGR